MYLSRTGSWLDLCLYLFQAGIWTVGGWLLVTHVFHLRPWERLLAGLATGWVVFIAVSNLLGHFLPLSLAFWLAAVLILAAGLGAAWRSQQRPRLSLADLSSWPQLAALFGLTGLFFLIERGLAIFDDYVHLPLTSIVGAGDIPPHFYVDPSFYFAYHYGLQLSGGSLERVAGLYPWTAWDLSKAFAIALTLCLGWLWVKRVTHSNLAGVLGSFLITFGGGARWLLLLIPQRYLNAISSHVTMINTGKDTASTLAVALTRDWHIPNGGPVLFPFAFHDGIFVPIHFILGSDGALPYLVVLLMLILAGKRVFSIFGAVIFSLVFAVLALSGEHVFVFLWGGLGLAGLIYLIARLVRRKSIDQNLLLSWAVVLGLSGVLAVLQGAYLTEAARGIVGGLTGAAPTDSMNFYGFSLRLPLASPDAHMAPLAIFDPAQLTVLLAELGPALLLLPLVTVFSWTRIRRRDWMMAGLGLGAFVSFFFSIFFQYGSDRSTTRLTATSLWIWLVLGFPLLWYAVKKAGSALRGLVWTGYGVAVLGGIVIFAVQMIAIPAPQLSYFIYPLDAQVTRAYWDKLEPKAQILDSMPERSVTIFGRASKARPWFYVPYPEWEALIANPVPATVVQSGYSYIYMDRKWWQKLTQDQKAAFQQPCVKLVDQVTGDNDFRRLYDVKTCK